jgi:hypothetical protein
LIRIAVTAAAFEAIVATLPFGTVSFERDPDANGEHLIWLAPHIAVCPCHALGRESYERGRYGTLALQSHTRRSFSVLQFR